MRERYQALTPSPLRRAGAQSVPGPSRRR
jgi:hypothetical protein